ncbi:MAG: hypothetical protein HN737_04865 [Desulfobacterales bacterium]|jgi:hypothetical protein|nr:hypothetical protein [Desulfobacteraceae bacterium]MBT4365678.1 hypothetical protein [Desulfobacteraceae bacterium]MBT7086318.1 hypothetical protein [Desulfobacterales bacterium]MBT7696725.1 hypothetical protein [Desulfobacterales bacterium]
MASSDKKKISVEEAGKILVDFSTDRNDLKMILGQLPENPEFSLVTVEYEMQLLKILSIGWGISYFMPEGVEKEKLAAEFWNLINLLSKDISLSISSIEKEIDYFEIIKKRLDQYLKVLQHSSKISGPEPDSVSDPASDLVSMIGPKFAEICGYEDNVFVIISGAKIFSLALSGLREYLESISLVIPDNQ